MSKRSSGHFIRSNCTLAKIYNTVTLLQDCNIHLFVNITKYFRGAVNSSVNSNAC